MRKSKRQEVALVLGALIMLIGIINICVATSAQWTLENFAQRIAQVICGSFMMVIGTYVFALGISDKVGKSTSSFLKYVWDRFLKAFNR